ncbi:hypothetical protein BHE74_00048354, partial [Ensete ventricosum]
CSQRDDKGFAHPERIQNLVKNYSQFVSFPIYTWQEKGFTKEVRDSSGSLFCDMYILLQLRNPKDVTTEEYNEFFRKTFNEYLDPLASSHFTTEFWENFGKNLKLGCIEDQANHKRIAPLLRFFSSHGDDELISLDEYVENMKPEQKDIYFIAADSLTSARNAPFLERLHEKDFEVLFLVDPMDEIAIQNLKSYKEKNFVDISKEDLDLGDKNEEKEKEIKQEYGHVCDWIKKRLGDKVASVQISSRLSTSPCVLVSGKFGWSANMER